MMDNGRFHFEMFLLRLAPTGHYSLNFLLVDMPGTLQINLSLENGKERCHSIHSHLHGYFDELSG